MCQKKVDHRINLDQFGHIRTTWKMIDQFLSFENVEQV